MSQSPSTDTLLAPPAGASIGVRNAAGALVVGAVVVVGGMIGPVALGVAVLVVQLCTLSGWHQLLRIPGAFGGSVVALAAGAGAVLVLLVDTSGSTSADVGRLAPVLALCVVACFAHQVLRGVARDRLVESLTGTAALVVAVVLSALWIAVRRGSDGLDVLLVGAVAAVVAAVGAAVGAAVLPRAGWVVSVLAGAGAGLVTGAAVGIDLSPPAVLLLAAGAAGPAVVAAHLRGATGRAARTAPGTLAALPVALAALPLWVLARILLG